MSDIEMDMVLFGLTGPPRRGILGARGLGKTMSVTCPLVAWRAYRAFYRFATEGVLCPDRKFILISKASTEARKTIALIREWIDHVWFLRHLAPQDDQNDRSDFFDFGPAIRGSSRQPSVSAFGNIGQLQGNRGHTIIPDDFETKANTQTQEAREALMAIAAEFDSIAFPDAPGALDKPIDPGEVCVIGTYNNEDSAYKKLAKLRMPDGRLIFTFRTYPLAAPARTDRFLNLAPIIRDKLESGSIQYTEGGNYHLNPLFPRRFDAENIGKKMAHGRHEFAMQHMLISDLDDSLRYPLRLCDLIVHDVPRDQAPLTIVWGRRDHNGQTDVKDIPVLGLPGDGLHYPIAVDRVLAPYNATKAVIDPAGAGRDKTGLACAGFLNGIFWVKHCRGHTGGVADTDLEALALRLRELNCREVWVEINIDIFDIDPGNLKGTFAPLLEVQLRKLAITPGQNALYPEGWSCSVQTFRVSGMKEARICDTLAPVLGSHRIVMDPACLIPEPGAPEHESLQYQFSRIQRVRKCLKEDGAIDALASLVSKFQGVSAGVRTDPNKQRDSREAQQIKALLKRQQRALGKPVEPVRMFRHH